MITRRNFLKLAGLSTLAVGSGYLTGKFTQTSKPIHYSIHGFIPEDEAVLQQILIAFKNKVKSNSVADVVSDSKFSEVIVRLNKELYNASFVDKGKITYKLMKIGKTVNSDIIVSDNNNSIYSLDDFNFTLTNIRIELKNRKADYFLSANYDEKDFFSSLFNEDGKKLVIENENGTVEKISLSKNYNSIWVDGAVGKVGLEINRGIVKVYTSSCKNKICKHTMAQNTGDIIACAPNKVLVKIV